MKRRGMEIGLVLDLQVQGENLNLWTIKTVQKGEVKADPKNGLDTGRIKRKVREVLKWLKRKRLGASQRKGKNQKVHPKEVNLKIKQENQNLLP